MLFTTASLDLLRTQHGVASKTDLQRSGLSDRTLRGLIEAGNLIGVVKGVYRIPAVRFDEAARCAAVCAAHPDAVVSGPTAGRLRANCPAARVHTCALGATVGTTTLGVTNDAAGTQRARVGTGTRPVRQLVGDYLATPDVLKVDVEGAEKGVLDGYRQTLADAAPHTVFVETHGSQADIVHTLVAAGYDITASWSVGVDETMLQATRQ